MIKKIKWNNHDILKNLELDFTKPDGTVYNTIVLAGENGAGKTTILDTLSNFLNLRSIEPFEYIDYEVKGVPFSITPDQKNGNAHLGFHNRKNENDGTTVLITSNRSNDFKSIVSDFNDLRHYGVSYSKARSGFKTKAVKSTTVQQLDSDKYEDDSNDDFTSIKQLLVDIDSQDNSEWMRISKSGTATSIKEFQNMSKMHRFEKSFNSFFENLRFKEVNNQNKEEIEILFEKNGIDIPVDSLSTGEKQIVFRGAHLLKNSNYINDGVVLIDEPELSMHPKWQQKILQYYRGLFNKNGKQGVQMIIATHSEYVIKSALEDRDNVLVVVLNDVNGVIVQKNITAPTVLPTITVAETNYLAFNVYSIDYHIELYGYLQNKTNNDSIKSCDDYISNDKTHYNSSLHEKPSSYITKNGNIVNYLTLPTYIRNLIDHPKPNQSYTQEELERSTELLIRLCK